MVIDGFVKREKHVRVLRDNVVIHEGELDSLRRFKDDVQEVKNGTECGIGIKNYLDINPGDVIENFEQKKKNAHYRWKKTGLSGSTITLKKKLQFMFKTQI